MLYLPMPAGKRLRYSFRICVFDMYTKQISKIGTYINKKIDKFWKQTIINIEQWKCTGTAEVLLYFESFISRK